MIFIKLDKGKKVFIGIIFLLAFLIAVSGVSAIDYNDIDKVNPSVKISDTEVVNKTIAKVNRGEKIYFTPYANLSTSMQINFGDNTSTRDAKSGNTYEYTYKKAGKYTFYISNQYNDGNSINMSTSVTIDVLDKPDLFIKQTQMNTNGKNVKNITVTIKNKGTVKSNVTYIKVWYNKTSLSKYSRTVVVKALNPQQETNVTLNFAIPYSYRNYTKHMKVDIPQKNDESIKTNNEFTFKWYAIDNNNIKPGMIINNGEILSNNSIMVNQNELLLITPTAILSDKMRINYGDGTTKTVTANKQYTHQYKKAGNYTITITNTYQDYKELTKIVTYVVRKADLYVKGAGLNLDAKGNVDSITLTIRNKGKVSSKATNVKFYYGNAKFSKYTKYISIPKISPGKEIVKKVAFKIPISLKNYTKYIQVDYKNLVDESIKNNNKLTFKWYK
ncbi:MAG: CARDB domain-containing protein [Methanobacteriaceae archaeon]